MKKLGAVSLPQDSPNDYSRRLSLMLYQYLNSAAKAINALISVVDAEDTAAPTVGTWSAASFVRNSAPAEAGTAGSKYVVLGWVCVTAGTPGTWLPVRALTGN